MSASDDALRAASEKIGLGHYERHVFLCVGPTCCSPETGQAAWDALKKALKDSGLGNVCQRTKAGCLRICCEGPTMVVYPEGAWYRNMTADRIERFVREHLAEGKAIREWIFADNPLPHVESKPGAEEPRAE